MNPQQQYTSNKSEFEIVLNELKKKRTRVALLRGIVFVITGFAIYYFWEYLGSYWLVLLPILAIFLWLVKQYVNLGAEISFFKNLIDINQTEIDVAYGDYFNLPDGMEFMVSDHPYCQDIDLFGQGSFYQFINRTRTGGGSTKLAADLLENSIQNIPEKQEELKELSQKLTFRQEFAAQAMMIKKDHNSKEIFTWFSQQKPAENALINYGLIAFKIISLILILLVGFKYIDGNFILYLFLFGLGVTSIGLKKTKKTVAQVSKYTETIKQYARLIQKIEDEEFKTSRLKNIQDSIVHKQSENDHRASTILNQLSKIINGFENRNNLIVAIVINGFFLYDYSLIQRLNKWMNSYGEQIEKWFNAIYYIDAMNTKAGYDYNHPSYSYPNITSDGKVVSAIDLGHPLINRSKRIDNDFNISKEEFMIITGANMAGKSTFLRTVALHIVISNNGMPAASTDMQYRPIKLISSMRTSDSLKDEESYFFSELKRLKYIVSLIEKDEYFIILDEILKGTNSKDKEEGSKKFVQRLISTNATGIIATHDLSLCELSDSYSEVVNKYFDAEIIDNELFFDYKFKEGICQNMNASFLLKKMEIV